MARDKSGSDEDDERDGRGQTDTSIHFREGTHCPPPMPVVKEEEDRRLTLWKSGTWCFVVPLAHFIGRRHAKIIGLVSFFIGGPPSFPPMRSLGTCSCATTVSAPR